MAENTTYKDVIDSFESSFADKQIIPDSLELVWFLKAVGRYSTELDPLTYDKDMEEFDSSLDRYTIDTLGEFMKQSYLERQLSLVNKRVSIVGKDISIDGSNGQKNATKAELEYIQSKTSDMVENQKDTAYV